ncbi:MAG TPA: hypothetical protein VFW87_00395 [Pirellulales bacterium]|nr:hypothetical protein [Pirellulales bacterium]
MKLANAAQRAVFADEDVHPNLLRQDQLKQTKRRDRLSIKFPHAMLIGAVDQDSTFAKAFASTFIHMGTVHYVTWKPNAGRHLAQLVDISNTGGQPIRPRERVRFLTDGQIIAVSRQPKIKAVFTSSATT